MNKELAQMYGTAGEETLEKQAAAELAEALSDDNGIDLSNLSVDDVEAIAAEMLGGGEEGAEKTAEEEEKATGEEGEEKTAGSEDEEAKQKLAEADYLGRVMAHAFHQEKTELEKEAGWKENLKGGAGKAREAAGKVGAKLKEMAGKAGSSKAGQFVGKHGKKFSAGAGAAGGFMAGRLSKKGKEKKGGAEDQESSTPALDALTANRVNEILTANGINPETLEKADVKAEKTAAEKVDPAELVASVVEDRALATLEAAGFDVSELRGEKAEEKK